MPLNCSKISPAVTNFFQTHSQQKMSGNIQLFIWWLTPNQNFEPGLAEKIAASEHDINFDGRFDCKTEPTVERWFKLAQTRLIPHEVLQNVHNPVMIGRRHHGHQMYCLENKADVKYELRPQTAALLAQFKENRSRDEPSVSLSDARYEILLFTLEARLDAIIRNVSDNATHITVACNVFKESE